MKISVDDVELFTLTPTQINVIKNDIPASLFQDDMKRRLAWVLNQKFEDSFKSLKQQWEPLLSERVESIPTNKESFANLVFSQPDYLDRESRDALIQQEQG